MPETASDSRRGRIRSCPCFGQYVEGDSWADLLRTYDMTAENLWILIPLWIAACP